MRDERVQAIRERIEAANPADHWLEFTPDESPMGVYMDEWDDPSDPHVAANREFVRHAPTDLADLLDERKKLLAVVEAARLMAIRIVAEGGHGYGVHADADKVLAAVRAYRATTGEAGQ